MTETTLDNSVADSNLVATETPATTSPETTVESTSPNFLDLIPAEYKEVPSIKNFKSLDDFVKSFVEKDKLIGKKVAEMSPEDVKAYNSKLGVPSTPDEYTLDVTSEIITPEDKSWFTKAAHEAGLSKDSAAKLSSKWSEYLDSQKALSEANLGEIIKAENESLKSAWGGAYDERIRLSDLGIERTGGAALKEVLEKTNMINSAELRKAFAEVGKLYAEDTVKDVRPGRFGLTRDEADMEIKKILAEHGDALVSQHHKEHSFYKTKYDELLKIKHNSAS